MNPNTAEATVALSDRTGTITVYKNGNVTGLDEVPASTRDQIAKVLLSERLERPPILKELGGHEFGLRGSRDKLPFKLIAPSGTVIVTDRPTLKWEKAAATSYRVCVNDFAGHVVKRSDELPSEMTEWKVTQALKRGKVYAWTVVAVIDPKKSCHLACCARNEVPRHIYAKFGSIEHAQENTFTSCSRSFLRERWSNRRGPTRVSGISSPQSKIKSRKQSSQSCQQ